MWSQNRVTTRRGAAIENNENNAAVTTRLTRSKSATLTQEKVLKKPLQSKKSIINAQPTRRRAALGDVSNVTKGDLIESKKGIGKTGLVSKAAQPTGVQKNIARPVSTRTHISSKITSKKPDRAGSGVLAGKRKTGPTSMKEETPADKQQPTRKKIHIEVEQHVEAEVKESKICASVEDEKGPTQQQLNELVQDLDQEDIDDPLMVSEYVVEIFEYLRKLELSTRPNPNYMDHQEDLEWKMRAILVDWLIEVHTRYHLLPETLFLAVNIIDRFLSTKAVQLDRLQLVGVTAMFIASKYEEVLTPHVANFRHVADDGFTEAEILSAERYVLNALNYDLSYPNPMNFLRRISKADDYDIQTRTLAKYLMEISLLDHRFMNYLPSHIAAASMYTARKILERGDWNPTLCHYAGYDENQIQPVFMLMVDYLARPIVYEALFKKYASRRFLKASIFTGKWAKNYAEKNGIDTSLPLETDSR
ncbi:G2/mitotic-specific [Podosphaera aphanis]|nr:G2/mitotic-specific [Podosphaera aphanis]